MTPVLLPVMRQVLQQLDSCSLSLPTLATAACKTLHEVPDSKLAEAAQLEEALVRLGALEGCPGEAGKVSV